MKVRADLTLNGENRRPALVRGTNELPEHVLHKLAAYLLFWNDDPTLDATPKMPALADWEFMPDLVAFDLHGHIKLWVEVDTVTRHQLTKVTRRAPQARVVVLKKDAREAQRLRKELEDQFDRPERVEILAWPSGAYRAFMDAAGDDIEAFGEADGRTLNAVVNEVPLVVEFEAY